MIRVLCYGDSNTWGYISGSDHKRMNENQRWTRLLQKQLGNEFEIIEEGLNSRTLCSEDRREGKEGKNGFTYLKPCMETHDKFDIMVLMLGSNELKTDFNNSAEDIFNMFVKFIKFIQSYKSKIDGTTPKLIVSGLPIVTETDGKYLGQHKKSVDVNKYYKDYCQSNNIPYIDNDDLSTGIDGIHYTFESHIQIANRLKDVILKVANK